MSAQFQNRNGTVKGDTGSAATPPRRIQPPARHRNIGGHSSSGHPLIYVLGGLAAALLCLAILAVALLMKPSIGQSSGGAGRAATGTDKNGAEKAIGSSKVATDVGDGAVAEEGELDGRNDEADIPSSDDDGTLATHSSPAGNESSEVNQPVSDGKPGDDESSSLDGKDATLSDESQSSPSSIRSFNTLARPDRADESGEDEDDAHANEDSDGTIEFFGVRGEGSRIVYIVDMSGSMAGYRANTAKQELLDSIRRLNRDQEFCILFFRDQMAPAMKVKLTRASPELKRQARLAVHGTEAWGGTDPTQAISTGIRLEPDVIFVLSDGEFGPGVTEFVNSTNSQTKIVINTIGFQVDALTLRDIAKQNRGEYRFVP